MEPVLEGWSPGKTLLPFLSNLCLFINKQIEEGEKPGCLEKNKEEVKIFLGSWIYEGF